MTIDDARLHLHMPKCDAKIDSSRARATAARSLGSGGKRAARDRAAARELRRVAI